MSDNAKLKELAEALKRAIEQAEHKPGEWAGTAQSMGGICCPGVPFQIGKPWAKEEPWASFSYKRDSWLAVAAVNALPRLLGLIADNEWLTKAVGLQVIRRFVGDDDQKNIDELVAAGIQVDKELIVQLKAENEVLRKDADRAAYWKQRAKSAEGHLFSGDFRAAAMELHKYSRFESTPWPELTGSQHALISSAAGAVIATVNRLRDARRPKNRDETDAIIWCACGDGHAVNSYGAGFMDANEGVCANCDAAMGKGEPL